jgi:RNA polymerase sigma-70 factor (ECF subfamily)
MADAGGEEDVLKDVRAARGGDGAAYGRIIRRYQQTLVRRMIRFARTPGDVEELVQDVFVQAYFSLPKFREEAAFEHWLQKIATRVGYRYWKRLRKLNKTEAQPLEMAADIAAGERNSGSEEAEALRVMMQRLGPRDRLVITLLHVEERSVEETAQLTGWSRTMVKVQAYRARGKLRRMMENKSERGAS